VYLHSTANLYARCVRTCTTFLLDRVLFGRPIIRVASLPNQARARAYRARLSYWIGSDSVDLLFGSPGYRTKRVHIGHDFLNVDGESDYSESNNDDTDDDDEPTTANPMSTANDDTETNASSTGDFLEVGPGCFICPFNVSSTGL